MRSALSELVDRKVDIIFVGASALASAARTATRDIPIVCGSCGDPIENGLAAGLARPGGNVTGLASQSAELIGKRAELLREAVPTASRITALVNPDNPGTPATLKAFDEAGHALGIQIQRVEFRNVGALNRAFRSAATGSADAILGKTHDDRGRDPRSHIGTESSSLAGGIRCRWHPKFGEFAQAGTLMSFGPSILDQFRYAASYVDKLFKGARPGDLPVEQATRFGLIVNLKTARALGLTIPRSVLLRTDQVID